MTPREPITITFSSPVDATWSVRSQPNQVTFQPYTGEQGEGYQCDFTVSPRSQNLASRLVNLLSCNKIKYTYSTATHVPGDFGEIPYTSSVQVIDKEHVEHLMRLAQSSPYRQAQQSAVSPY